MDLTSPPPHAGPAGPSGAGSSSRPGGSSAAGAAATPQECSARHPVQTSFEVACLIVLSPRSQTQTKGCSRSSGSPQRSQTMRTRPWASIGANRSQSSHCPACTKKRRARSRSDTRSRALPQTQRGVAPVSASWPAKAATAPTPPAEASSQSGCSEPNSSRSRTWIGRICSAILRRIRLASSSSHSAVKTRLPVCSSKSTCTWVRQVGQRVLAQALKLLARALSQHCRQ
mmetsp:Transcript_31641/g.90823  ORF Transcript_31641/g.90823 Transcript_31641/m.90823 type:complete len:229 (+) Transcript_31641:272-958(+)